MFTTIAILKDALLVLMEGNSGHLLLIFLDILIFLVFLPGLPRGLDFNIVQESFLSIEGVSRVHNLRIWALSMDKVALSAHLAIRK